jgi:membrane associated rhomboid family serine protease
VTTSFGQMLQRAPVTTVVLVAYVALGFVTMTQGERGAWIFAMGQASGITIQHGEVWRLLTYSFLHGGPLHLFLNSYFLLIIGSSLEQAIGTHRYVLLYAVTAIGGGVGGCLWHPHHPLVGGSGALFGMMGCALALNMRLGRHLLDFLNFVGPRQLVTLIVANLLLGMMIPMVSNAGHIGGLVSGFVMSFCFLQRGRDAPDRLSHVIQAGWIALLCSLVFYCVRPVVRVDYLADEFDRSSAERRAEIAEVLLRPEYAQYLTPEGLHDVREAARKGR